MGLLYLILAILSKRKSFWRNCIVLAIISGLITVGWDVYMKQQPNASTFHWSAMALPAGVDFFEGFIQVVIGFGLVWICKRLFVWRKEKSAQKQDS
jgi:hypothetical protein